MFGAYRGKGIEANELWPLEVQKAVCLSVVCLGTHAKYSQGDGGQQCPDSSSLGLEKGPQL